MSTPLKRTPLYHEHVAAGARMVPFGGWEMPVQYTGIIEEHRAARGAVGLFDVSHMGEFEIEGPGALAALQHLTTNDVATLEVGQVQYSVLCYQTGALREFIRAAGGGELQHTKPHGILYSMIEKDDALATAVAESARESGKELILMALGSGKYDRLARKMGVRVASEGFADRAYNVDLTLVSRKLSGSLITDPERAAAQAVKMAMEGKVRTIDGVDIDIAVQTICCHGDTPGAQKIVRTVREALDRAGCQVKPLRDFLPKA